MLARARGGAARIWHVPAAPIVGALAALERIAGGAIPITAGQFYGFLHDTTATPSALVDRLLPARRDVNTMVAELGEEED
jgi:hypothetical protein